MKIEIIGSAILQMVLLGGALFAEGQVMLSAQNHHSVPSLQALLTPLILVAGSVVLMVQQFCEDRADKKRFPANDGTK